MAGFTFIAAAASAGGIPGPGLGLGQVVANADAELAWVETADGPIPFTLANGRAGDACYLTSPVSAWLRYSAAEIADAAPRRARAMTWAADRLSGSGFARTIFVGNLPISTNLYGEAPTSLLTAVDCVRADFPDRWIGVRNVRPDRQSVLVEGLTARGFILLPARVVYEFATAAGDLPRASHLKRDLALLKRGPLRPLSHDDFDAVRLADCARFYDAIYLDKHSTLNARYTIEFFARAHACRALEFIGFEGVDGRLDGFAAIHAAHDVMTVPALGYNPALPKELGLYRCLTGRLIQIAADRRLTFNYSSGAGDAKRKRGADPKLEWTAIRPPSWGPAAAMRRLAPYLVRTFTLDRLIALGA